MEVDVQLRPGEEYVITRDLSRRYFIAPCSFGFGERSFLVDTGASVCVLDVGDLREATGREVQAGEVHVLPELRTGPITARSVPTLAHDMSDLSMALGRRIDGILGYPVFRSVLLDVDYPAQEVRVRHGSVEEPDGRWVLPLRSDRACPYIDVTIGSNTVPVLLDTGASGGLGLHDVPPDLLASPLRPVATVVTIRGRERRLAGRLRKDVRIGPIVLHRPIVADHEPNLVGWQVLRRFVLTFDQRRDRVRLLTHAHVVTSPSIEGLGMSVVRHPAGLRIIDVFPGDPAAEAGLAPGDVIVAIDGEPVPAGPEVLEARGRAELTLTLGAGRLSHEVRVPYATLVK